MAEVKVNASVTYACPIHDLAMMDEIIQNLESRYAQIEGYRGPLPAPLGLLDGRRGAT